MCSCASVAHTEVEQVVELAGMYKHRVEQICVQCQTAKIDKKFKRCNLVRKAQKEILQKCDKKKIVQRQI